MALLCPDLSSQIACSVGGNVAENSGGVHCLKYGLTTNLLGIELVTIEGEIMRLGGKHLDSGDYDLMGVMTGSRALGIVSEVTLRICKSRQRRALLVGFDDIAAAATGWWGMLLARYYSGWYGNDGWFGDQCGRGFACRLSA